MKIFLWFNVFRVNWWCRFFLLWDLWIVWLCGLLLFIKLGLGRSLIFLLLDSRFLSNFGLGVLSLSDFLFVLKFNRLFCSERLSSLCCYCVRWFLGLRVVLFVLWMLFLGRLGVFFRCILLLMMMFVGFLCCMSFGLDSGLICCKWVWWILIVSLNVLFLFLVICLVLILVVWLKDIGGCCVIRVVLKSISFFSLSCLCSVVMLLMIVVENFFGLS